MDMYLETERLLLRRFTPDDLELIVELDSDPGVKRYIDNGAPIDRQDLVETLDWWLGYYERSEGYGFWAAVEKATGRFVGWFHFRPGEGAGPLEPELGYRLHSEWWGQGYATEGSRALIDKGFAELGVERVYAQTMAVNAASRRGDGEGRFALRASVPRRLACQHSRRRTRRRRVRDRPSPMGSRSRRPVAAHRPQPANRVGPRW